MLKFLSRQPYLLQQCCIFMLLTGCSTYRPQKVDPVQSIADFEGRRLDDVGLRRFISSHASRMGLKGHNWGLGRLTLAALYFHPDIEVARSERMAADAAEVTAAERPNPTLSLTPGYDALPHGVISPWLPIASIDVPIETAGKRGLRQLEAAHKAEIARWKTLSMAWQVRSRLRKAMLAELGAKRSEALLLAQKSVQADTVKLLDERRIAGESTPFEAMQARMALSQTQLALSEAQRQTATAHVQLAEAIGVPSQALREVTIDFSELEFDQFPDSLSSAKAKKIALTHRADILAALEDYAATDVALRLEIAKQYPDVHLAPGYQFNLGDNQWLLGISFQLPILNQNRGKIGEAEGQRQVAAAKFKQVQVHAIAEIEAAQVDYRGAAPKAESARQLLAEAEAREKAAKDIKAAGAVGRFEVLQRQLETSVSALALQDARLRAEEALGTYEDALQSSTTLPASALLLLSSKP